MNNGNSKEKSSSNQDSEELKAKYAEIAALKKAIDEKQSQKQTNSYAQPDHGHGRIYRGGFRGRRATRGAWRGSYRPHPYDTRHRNHTLVLSNGSGNDESKGEDESQSKQSEEYITTVHKNGMSLVNKEMYEKDKNRRLKIAEDLKKHKEEQRKQSRIRTLENRIAKYRTKTDYCDRVKIEGDIYAVTKQGNKLIPLNVPGDEKRNQVQWNGKVYLRKHNGALKCQGGREFRVPTDQCRYFTRTGICQKGSQCKYLHDSSRIRICRQYLSNSCQNKQCLLSHRSNEHNTPICKYFLENKCFNSGCLYQHYKPKEYDTDNSEIWVCRPFAIGGWCDRGKSCPFMHLFNCPDFEESGRCPRGQHCILSHPITRRIQELMSTSSSEPATDGDVLVESDGESDNQKIVINSYTVEPKTLLHLSKRDKYAIYIDKPTDSVPAQQGNSQYTIVLSDSDSDSGSSEDSSNRRQQEIEKNKDYIEI